ncbi:MAG: hypothetical protein DRP65_00065 [Planctomycetota bacterium]|nr:MAG: hypothetical protein DRP65_00065 [Planctomycetota bacterium]
MAWAYFTPTLRNLDVYLVDGYLPARDILIRLAEQSAEAPALKSNIVTRAPYSWDDWDEDAIYEKLAYNTRKVFCAARPPGKRISVWSEAWLLKPEQWPPEFELKEQKGDMSNRRLLVTLYEDCAFGKKCLTNLVKKSRLDVIPAKDYRDHEAFKHKGEALLEDISLPFIAPCLVAGERIQAQDCEYRAFGI